MLRRSIIAWLVASGALVAGGVAWWAMKSGNTGPSVAAISDAPPAPSESSAPPTAFGSRAGPLPAANGPSTAADAGSPPVEIWRDEVAAEAWERFVPLAKNHVSSAAWPELEKVLVDDCLTQQAIDREAQAVVLEMLRSGAIHSMDEYWAAYRDATGSDQDDMEDERRADRRRRLKAIIGNDAFKRFMGDKAAMAALRESCPRPPESAEYQEALAGLEESAGGHGDAGHGTR